MKSFLSSPFRLLICVWACASAPLSAVAQTALAGGAVGVAYSYQVTTNPAPAAGAVYAATSLPPGLAINASSGLISGTPTTAGTFLGNVSITAGGNTNVFDVSIAITGSAGTPVITSALTAGGTAGSAFTSYTITASPAATSFNITGTLPAGMTVNSATGVISASGALATNTAGTYTVSISGNNAAGTGAPVTLTISIAAATSAPVITSAAVASFPNGSAGSYQIVATNSPTSYSASGLPAGVSLNTGTGLISGTATVSGTYSVALTAANAAGTSAVTTLQITVGSVPVITSGSTVAGVLGVPFSFQLTASPAATSFNVTGLPAGLVMNLTTGLISGTPVAVGTSSVTISANNASGTGPTATLSLTVSFVGAPVVTSALTASGTVGVAFTYTITATNTPTSFSAAPLPGGLTLNASTGLISGTPSTGGAVFVTISATNASGTGPSSVLSIVVNPPAGGGGGGGGGA